MAEPSLVIQGWVKETLSALTALTDISCPVMDWPFLAATQKPPAPPYVLIGEGETLPGNDEDGCTDAFTVNVTIQAFSKKPGYPEVKAIGAAIYGALHEAEPTLTGFSVDHVLCQSITYQREPDGLSSRAILQFEIGVHENA